MASDREYLKPFIICDAVVPKYPPSGQWHVDSDSSTIALAFKRKQAEQLIERLHTAIDKGWERIDITCTRSSKTVMVSGFVKAPSKHVNPEDVPGI